jgi:hypothetical protein
MRRQLGIPWLVLSMKSQRARLEEVSSSNWVSISNTF